ncbi:MAG: Ig-like domain-containing protein, partial [Candidatus Thermoplasmatota archaeon]
MKKIVFLLALFIPILAKGNVFIEAPSVILVEENFYLYVNIQDVEMFNSADYSIFYNSSIFMIESLENGNIDGTEIPCIYSIKDGEIKIVSNLSLSAVNGSGYLSKIKLKSISNGSSYISIDGNLSNFYGNKINVSWYGKEVIATHTRLEVEAPAIVAGNFYAFINVSNVSFLNAMNFSLIFDRYFLEFVEIENGSIEGNEVFVYYMETENGLKIVALTNASGSGCIAKIKFRPLTLGIASINISDVTLSGFYGEIFAYVINKTILISSSPPVAVDDTATTSEDVQILINVTENDYDIDGSIDLSSITITQAPSHGSLTVHSNGTVTYTPNANYHGSDSFKYKVKDNDGIYSNEAFVNITIGSVNDPPVAVDDSYTIDEDAVLNISLLGVLANDSDADGDNLTAILLSNPIHGSLTLNSNGSFVYIPSLNYYGSDSFTYKAFDGQAYSNIATVYITINPINDEPIANDDYASLEEDNSIIISILSNDYDIDGTINESSVRIIQNASYGSLIINPNGTIKYIPKENYYGNDLFKYRVMDNSNSWSNIATVYINITPVNDEPYKPSLLIPENNSINVSINATLIAHVIDIDSDIITVKFYGRKLGATWQLIGTKTNVENNSNVSLVWYNLEYNTTYEWYAVANDSFSENISDIWRFKTELSTINTPPVANNDYYSTDEDIALIINSPGILANDSDADNDSLTAILLNNPSNGSIVLNSNGSFVYIPFLNYYGSDSFTYKANDGISDSNIATVYITINPINDEPIANFNFYPENPTVGQTIYFNSTSYDIDGSLINWTWNFDNFFAYEENTTYIYSEAGKHNVTLIVKDTDGATASIVKEVIVQISDDVPPLTKIEFGLPYYYDGTKEWIRSSTLITLSASDEGSGVDRTYYKIDD